MNQEIIINGKDIIIAIFSFLMGIYVTSVTMLMLIKYWKNKKEE